MINNQSDLTARSSSCTLHTLPVIVCVCVCGVGGGDVERKQRLTGKWTSHLPRNVIHTGKPGILEMFAESHGSMIQNYDLMAVSKSK
jgi:hypothetical protein